MFFSLDGIDGVGKSTQAQLLCDALRREGYEVVACRDPGSTQLGEKVRDLLLAGDSGIAISLRCEMLLYMAARAQLVDEIIRPALEAGKIVVSDRFLLANIAYQGHAGGLDPEVVRQVARIATAGTVPDCVFLLDMELSDASRRLNRPLDRMESLGDLYRKRLQNGFRAEAALSPGRIHLINASRAVDDVHHDIWHIARNVLAKQIP